MNLLESVKIALQSLPANKLRSGLTMLGIIIGVGAVIALVAAGAGAKAKVTEQFESLGSNLLTISARGRMFRGVGMSASGSLVLSADDVEAIASLSQTISGIAPEYSTSGQVAFGSNNTQTSVTGVTAAYRQLHNWTVEKGRFIQNGDTQRMAKVAVLGATTAEDLFGTAVRSPIGKTIKINRQNYQVIGILKSKGSSGMASQDEGVYIPLSTAQVRFGGAGNTSLSGISVQVVSEEKMDLAEAELTAILRASHGLTSSQSSDFAIQNQAEIVEMVASTADTFSVLLGSIAGISLVVGGIGIMNIMLVSVTERTREIGIRKAVGAKERDILTQFLVEAMVLSLAGGLLGILVGWGAAQIVTPLLGGTRAVVTPGSIALAVGVSIAVGVFFGIYPASRAAALSPIEALRYQ
ncbi:MAG TPA: ABC transporter permease [Anaerolineae bacterium]|nr:ABC transporter permease [Anaerolineae bacterium]